MRVCIVYDCLYPYSVGGAERWYRSLSERLAEDGHEVTYLTLRQWEVGAEPAVSGVKVIAVGPSMALYSGGRRRIRPPLVFGLGVLRHLAARGHHYDVVHTASFPYFSLLAAGLVRSVRGFRIVVDWHEVWTRDYWREYLGAPLDRIGWSVQKLCLRIPQHAFCFSHLHERRLHGQGVAGPVTVLTGQYDGPTDLLVRPAEPLVVFAGRHIPEKRAPAVVPAVARALTEVPGLRAIIYGDGPDRPKVLELIRALGLEDIVEAPGFVDGDEIDQALGRALCLVLPSRREGYGRVVVEALARGTPVVVTAGPDNAAVELVEDRANGFVAPSGRPDDLAEAILRVRRAGDELRRSTAEWYRRHAEELSLEGSLEVVTATYREPAD